MEADEAKVFVGRLLREVDEEALRQHFSRYGAVVRAIVIRDRITKASRGHGFVWFSDPSSAKEALEHNEHIILGKAVEVKRPALRNHQSQTPQYQPTMQNVHEVGGNGYVGNNGDCFRTKKIFVGGLPASLTEDEFKNFFERFGKTTDVVIMIDSLSRKPRGFGFITYESEESVECVMRRNYYNLNGKYVQVKRAVPKNVNYCIYCSNYANGHVGRGSASIQGPTSISPYYPAYGPFPSYGFFPGHGKSATVPYMTQNYWVPYPTTLGNISYGPSPIYENGFVWASFMEDPSRKESVMAGVNQVNEVDSNGTEGPTGEMEDVSPQIGDLKLDDDTSDQCDGGGASSS